MPGPWGKAIEGLRLAKRLSRQRVAAKTKMTPTTYGRIEKGRHTQTRKLQDIADFFGVPIEEVLQSSPLQSMTTSPISHPTPAIGSLHEQRDSLSTDITARHELQALQAQVNLLQAALADIAAEREVQSRRRRKRLPTARDRKPLRTRNARKAR